MMPNTETALLEREWTTTDEARQLLADIQVYIAANGPTLALLDRAELLAMELADTPR